MKTSTLYRIIKSLFISKSFLGQKSKQKNHSFLLGSRKGWVLYDLERALLTFIKVLNIINYLNNTNLRILFVGCPPHKEQLVKGLLLNSPHFFVSSSDWISGNLSNRKRKELFPNLIVLFNNDKNHFSNSEVLKQGIPLVSFMDAEGDLKGVDFPIVLNTQSEGVENLFLLLIRKSITK